MSSNVYAVAGMTCEHCVEAVRTEVGAVPGVDSVDVELANGRVTVTGAGYTEDMIRAAVDEAGYDLAEP